MNGCATHHQDVLKLVCYGYSNKVIADKLCLSVKTVEKHRQKWLNHSNCHAIIPLLRWAMINQHISTTDWLTHRETL
jgi:two-component system secretion response regulator SsrB